MKNVLITGGKGQLASCIESSSKSTTDINFYFVDYDELDITKKQDINTFFIEHKISHCVNCAAYTAVDKAELESEQSREINEIGAKNLAEACNKFDATLIQISTDFVFGGDSSKPYLETDNAKPLGVYGITKLNGEFAVAKALVKHFIIRTSWLYSEHGNNFLKTMLRLAKEREEISIVWDQVGTPTYAGDLAEIVLNLIVKNEASYGTYHYSNEGVASWYDFAKAIFEESETPIKVLPINTEAYPTPAKRPSYSVMDKAKIKQTLQIEIPYWRDSLKKALSRLQ